MSLKLKLFQLVWVELPPVVDQVVNLNFKN